MLLCFLVPAEESYMNSEFSIQLNWAPRHHDNAARWVVSHVMRHKIFILTMLIGAIGNAAGGALMSVSGWFLLFPYLPGNVTALQFWTVIHAVIAMLFIAAMLAHIYIGSIGMEGAFDAMGTGEVDLNWAKEHHSLWVEEQQKKAGASTRKGKEVYLHVLKWPQGALKLPALSATIKSARLLSGGKAEVRQSGSNLEVIVAPEQRDPHDTVVVLKLDRPAAQIPAVNVATSAL